MCNVVGTPDRFGRDDQADRAFSYERNILSYNRGWQFPAITEQHAFNKIRESAIVPKGVTYIAYPWATLIDKLKSGSKDAQDHLKTFQAYTKIIPKGTWNITVCQHIAMREFLHLFSDCSIDEVFWSHAKFSDLNNSRSRGILIKPFPLYPVQARGAKIDLSKADRRYLFSFVGAKSEKFYLTESRNLINNFLGDHSEGKVILREKWHYDEIVYSHQIHGRSAEHADCESLIDKDSSDEFRNVLLESVFSLCPSGSGPNTIRLWESFGMGSIPIILSDQYAPPGDIKIWSSAVIFCEETADAIKLLPEKLRAISTDRTKLKSMRLAGQKIWDRYGPNTFIYDIRSRMQELGESTRTTKLKGTPLQEIMSGKVDLDDEPTKSDLSCVLNMISSRLLIEKSLFHFIFDRDAPESRLTDAALKRLPETHSAVINYHRVVKYLQNLEKLNPDNILKT